MNEAATQRWQRRGAGLLGLVAGLALMRLLLPGADATADAVVQESREAAARHDDGEASSASAAKSRTRAAGKEKHRSTGTLSFTPAQWAKVTRNPRHYYVSLPQCFPLPEAGSGVFDGRGFLSDPHPSFVPQAELFGWRQDLRLKVRELVLEYARELAAAEKAGAKVEYPGPGEIRIDLSAARAGREAAVAALKKHLEATVGRRDAERFLALAGLEGASMPLQDDLWIRATYDDKGDVIVSGADGMQASISRALADADYFRSENFAGRYQGRLGHLGLEIDWARLNPAAEEDGP